MASLNFVSYNIRGIKNLIKKKRSGAIKEIAPKIKKRVG